MRVVTDARIGIIDFFPYMAYLIVAWPPDLRQLSRWRAELENRKSHGRSPIRPISGREAQGKRSNESNILKEAEKCMRMDGQIE